MLIEIGDSLLMLSLMLAVYAAGAAGWSIHTRDERWGRSAQNATYTLAGLLGLAVAILLGAFLSNHFEVRYVAQHSASDLPLYLKMSALWAGQEGSLLFWGFLQALCAAIAVGRPPRQARALAPWAAVFLNLITAFFVTTIYLQSNPFILLAAAPPEGQGLNPLLRHPGMIFHPPALYVGFVSLSVPFAFTLAALLTRRVAGWTSALRPWILLAWLSLGAGLLLGMRWAYDVLGWGGYWGWDPVENAGLLPWLVATALLHGAVMQTEQQGFHLWNLLLAVAAFALTLFGAFATRSGAIESVHAFADSGLGSYFLTALVVTLGGAIILFIIRRDAVREGAAREDAPLLSRQGSFFLTLTLLMTLTASVLVGSLLPALTELLFGRRFVATADWFDRVTGPQWAALLLLMGLCPLLGQAATALRRLRRRGWPLLVAGALATVLIAFALDLRHPVSLVGFTLVGMAGAVTLAELAGGAYHSFRAHGLRFTVLRQLLRHRRRLYGGYLVHAGVVLMAIGVIGTRLYPFSQDVALTQDRPTQVGGYTLTYETLRHEIWPDHETFRAAISVTRGQAHAATLHPRLERYPGIGQNVTTPALRYGVNEDLYLVLMGWNADQSVITLRVAVNLLINFLWLGGATMLAGGLLAFWPGAEKNMAMDQ
ncbi:MAG TPA: cytochrome c-type biogenesis CcmF C-terminal domain-containing protein [Anaerolineae bacterium]|nr:cytochrome c-type biogenesis CcmF C-terminal domain-containing protein [Anaerolineae bacterium]